MSLILIFIYWVAIPVFAFLTLRGLLRKAMTPLSKGLIVVIGTAGFLGWGWLVAGERLWLDHQVRELCAKDGGIKVYETVKLPAEEFNQWGQIRIPSKQAAKPDDQYFYESFTNYLRKGNPEIWQSQYKVYRRADNRLLGESLGYARRGGDLPGPWNESSFGCPRNTDITDLNKQIFTKN